MEPDTAQQDTQEASQEQEEEDEADPVMLAKKQKQLAKRGVSFEAKVDPKVGVLDSLEVSVWKDCVEYTCRASLTVLLKCMCNS